MVGEPRIDRSEEGEVRDREKRERGSAEIGGGKERGRNGVREGNSEIE